MAVAAVFALLHGVPRRLDDLVISIPTGSPRLVTMESRFSLVFEGGNRDGESLPLRQSRMKIGRKPGNDLVLDDANVSGAHAEIVLEGGRFVLRDLGSTNGTVLDGRKIEEAILSHDDKITIGQTFLRFVDAQAGADKVSEPHRLKPSVAPAKRSMLLPAVVLIVVLAAGGFYFWTAGNSPARTGSPVTPVAGNLLKAFSFEASETDSPSGAWSFQDGSEESFSVVRGARSGAAAAGANFSGSAAPVMARLAAAQPVSVQPGQRYRLAGWVHSKESAAALGVRFEFSAISGLRIEERTPWHRSESSSGMTRVETEVDVPPGADRATVFALGMGSDGSVVWDDLEFVKTGSAPALAKFQEFAFRFSAHDGFVHKIDEYLLHSFRNEWRDRAGKPISLALDATVAVEAQPTGFDLRYTAAPEGGPAILRFSLTPDGFAAGGVMTLRGRGSALYTSDFQEDKVESLVLGGEAHQMRMGLSPASLVRGRMAQEGFVVEIPWEKELRLSFQMSFEEEKRKASELLLEAQKKEEEKIWGGALDLYASILNQFPFEKRSAEKARARYDALLREGQQRIVALEKAEEEARFFGLRDGYLQAKASAESLVKTYAGSEIATRAEASLARILSGLQELQVSLDREEAARLKGLAAGLDAAKQKKLAEELRAYLRTHYTESRASSQPSAQGGND